MRLWSEHPSIGPGGQRRGAGGRERPSTARSASVQAVLVARYNPTAKGTNAATATVANGTNRISAACAPLTAAGPVAPVMAAVPVMAAGPVMAAVPVMAA